MKKTLLLPVLLLGLILASCGSNSSAKGEFKDYSYDKILTENEAKEVVAKVLGNINNISSAELTNVHYAEYNNFKEETKTVSKASISSEGYSHTERKQQVSKSGQGLSWKEKHEEVVDMAFASKEDNYIMMTYSNTDGKENLTAAGMPKASIENLATYMSKTMFAGYFNNLNNANIKVFKAKKGFEAVLSAVVEEHTAVVWGNDSKEKITIHKTQDRYVINDKYQVTELVADQESHANQDPTTNEWYKDVRLIDKVTVNGKAKYEPKASNASLSSELISKGANSILSNNNLFISKGKVVDGAFTPSGDIDVEQAYFVKTGINTARVGFTFDLVVAGEDNAFSFKLSSSVKDDVFADYAAKTKYISVNFLDSHITNENATYLEETIPVAVFGDDAVHQRGLLEFELTSSSSEIAASNINFTLA